MKFNDSLKYYLITIPIGVLSCLIFYLIGIEFVNIVFFMMAYIWHFSLLAPKVKEYALFGKNKYSLLSLVFKSNYYLQMFIRFEKFKYTSSVVRFLSPLIFTLFLFIVGGSGNLFFTILGSLVFEVIYLTIIRKGTTGVLSDPEIPPAIPTEENSHE